MISIVPDSGQNSSQVDLMELAEDVTPVQGQKVTFLPLEPITMILFFKRAFPGLFFFIFVFSGLQLTDTHVRKQIYHCRCWDSNHGSLVLEATALPTAPQPRPSLSNL